MKVIQKPVTYKAEQCNMETGPEDFKALLEGTGIKLHQWQTNHYSIEHRAPVDCARGSVENIWLGDWLVVSSLGKVRVLNEEEYSVEFYDDWETPETPEDKIALIAYYVNKLVTISNDKGELSVDIGDWSKLEQLGDTR